MLRYRTLFYHAFFGLQKSFEVNLTITGYRSGKRPLLQFFSDKYWRTSFYKRLTKSKTALTNTQNLKGEKGPLIKSFVRQLYTSPWFISCWQHPEVRLSLRNGLDMSVILGVVLVNANNNLGSFRKPRAIKAIDGIASKSSVIK